MHLNQLAELLTSAAEQAAEKVASANESVPQRLKPDCKCRLYGTDKSVPLSKTGFSAACEAAARCAAVKGTAEAAVKGMAEAAVTARLKRRLRAWLKRRLRHG